MAQPDNTRRHAPVSVLWCSNQRRRAGNGWSFPPNVRRLLAERTEGKRVLHPFGGLATFGVRCDIDARVRPDVIADAFLLPFGRDTVDVVILDPPYVNINCQVKGQLLTGAGFVARESVVWFHTMWIATNPGLRLREAWLVRVGDTCAVRALQWFDVVASEKCAPPLHFTRGPAIRYNRWLSGQLPLLQRDDGPAS